MWPLLICGAAILYTVEARRIQYRPVQEQEEETVQYYTAAEPRDGSQQAVVYVSAADQYNGLYGQPTASPRSGQDNYIQQIRGASIAKASRVKETVKAPPVQTIRNYNKVNDDGSFTFGYEAADGSFKEETRGTDCVVRGKYGYVDPDGNKREFTYVSGNPCDPNAPKEDVEDKQEEESNEPENLPANYPLRPVRPLRQFGTSAPKPAITLYQNNYAQEEDVQPEPEQLLRQPPAQSARVRPTYITRPQYLPEQESEEEPQAYARPRLLAATTPSSVVYKHTQSPVNITPRPLSLPTPTRAEPPATTYRPQLLQVAVTPRPAFLYTKQLSVTPRPAVLSTTPFSPLSGGRGNIDFDAEFQKFQQENNVLSPTPQSLLGEKGKATKPGSSPSPNPGGQIYSSQLVFDPSSGQYNTQLYQTLPQTEGDFTFNHRIQPYVHQPQQLLNLQQLQQQSPLYRTLPQPGNQAVYQQQQADLQFQNSAQLYAQQQQQQRVRAQQVRPTPTRAEPQPFYYIQQSPQQPQALVGGNLDSFLRGHNIQF